MGDETYKLDELARAAGTSPRTVRYYVQRGLLPAPAFRGKDTAYGKDHLVRLRAIRRLAEAFFPLDAIAVELERRSIAEIERLADGELPAAHAAAVPAASGRPEPSAPPLLPRTTFERVVIAPGVDLTIAEDAPAESRRLAERLLRALDERR